MREPEDYGLSPDQTLIQVAPSCPPSGFLQHWSSWRERVWAGTPAFGPLRSECVTGAGATGVTHIFDSVGNVRIGCRVEIPQSGEVRAVVLTTHGYHMPQGEPLRDDGRWSGRAVATVQVRVRGYPGSQFDTGDLTSRPEGYASIGLECPGASILFDAVADLVNAVRAARARFGRSTPLFLHGESFGAGLAILTASLLPRELAPRRLVLGVPTFGWWGSRLAHQAHSGAGRDIAASIARHPERALEMLETLSMLDAVVHARRVMGAALCKVAERDDVVPAPTAAAVYNALGSDPGRKWRFVTRYAHFDGGLADLRRHAMFEGLAASFLDPSEEVDKLMRWWEPLLRFGEKLPPHARAGVEAVERFPGAVSAGGR